MNLARIEAIARAVLYEGYNLYPYRPSALKNRQRWSFGSVFPRDWARCETGDRSGMQTECLVQGDANTLMEVRVRFLHIVAREVGELLAPVASFPQGREPAFRTIPALAINGTRYLTWEEARERDIAAPVLSIARLLAEPAIIPFALPAERSVEPIRTADTVIVGLIIRTANRLNGEIMISAEQVSGRTYRIRVRIENLTPLPGALEMSRDLAQRSAFASTHTLLGINGGTFVSLLDPPPALTEATAALRNEGTWPVLAGEQGEHDLMLSSPIILYDHPRIAPESPGDLFDGCEIDEILTLRILTLTEEEKREMAAADPRTRALLERTEALTAEELAALHGTFRTPHSKGPALRAGDRVRLKPKSGGDIMDMVLQGQIAVIESVERDFEDRLHIAVTLLDDPGRDLGMARMPGHRFFFAQDEIERIDQGSPACRRS